MAMAVPSDDVHVILQTFIIHTCHPRPRLREDRLRRGSRASSDTSLISNILDSRLRGNDSNKGGTDSRENSELGLMQKRSSLIHKLQHRIKRINPHQCATAHPLHPDAVGRQVRQLGAVVGFENQRAEYRCAPAHG
jgi:hypothetical protein